MAEGNDKKGPPVKEQKEFNNLIERSIELDAKLAEAVGRRNQAAGTSLDFSKAEATVAEAQLELLENKHRLDIQRLAMASKAGTHSAAELKTLEDQVDESGQLVKNQEKLTKEKQATADANDSIADSVKGIAAAATGVSDAWKGTIWGKTLSHPAGVSAGLSQIGESLGEVFNAADIAGSGLMKVQEATAMMVMSASKHFAEVNKLTGATGEYNSMIIETMQHNSQFNVDMGTAAAAVSDLYTNMSQFTEYSKETQAELVEVTAQLEAVGLASGVTSENFEVMTKAMGMSTDEAINAQMEFVGLAKELGVSASKIGKDFVANQSVFAKWGDNAVQVFKEVSAASKATGIEMSSLLSITGQFDTFEGAANAAGKLNAILGGGVLNSMDLLNASESERIRMLIQSIDLSGKSWQSMNRFEKMAVANAAGISDMAEASKIFGQSLSAYDAMATKADAAAASQKQLAERAEAAADVQAKLMRIMESFAVAIEPIVNAITWLLNGILWLNDVTGGLFIPTLVGLAVIIWAITAATAASAAAKAAEIGTDIALITAETALAVAKEGEALASGMAAEANAILATQLAALAVAIVPLTPAIIALGFGIGALGLAIAAPFIAFAALAIAMKDIIQTLFEFSDRIIEVALGLMILGPVAMAVLPMIGIGIGLMAVSLALAAPALAIAGIAMIPFAAGLMAMGAAINLIGGGLKSLSDGFRDFPYKHVVDTALALMLAAPMLLIAGVFLAAAGLALGPGGLLVGIGLGTIGKAVSTFNEDGMFKTMLLLGPALVFFSFFMAHAGLGLMAAAHSMIVGGAGVGIGLIVLGAGIKSFMEEGIYKHMILLGPALLVFSLFAIPAAIALAVAGLFMLPAGLAVGLGLMALGAGIKQFASEDMLKTMAILSPLMILFSAAMLPAAIALAVAGLFMLPAGLMMGAGLYVLGQGLQEMKRTGGTMVMMMLIMPLFATSMLFVSGLLAVSAFKMLKAGVMMGIGLGALGMGINIWDGGTLVNAALLGPALVILGISLFIGTMFMAAIATPFAIAALQIGVALAVLGGALLLWDTGTVATAALIGPALVILGISLLYAVIPLWLASILFVPAALAVGFALLILGVALNTFGKKALRATFLVGPALAVLGFSLLAAVFPLWLASILFVPAALAVGFGLLVLGTAIRLIRRSIRYMVQIGPALEIFAKGLLGASWRMWLASIFFAPAAYAIALPLILLAVGLKGLGKALRKWGSDGGEKLAKLGIGLLVFGLALLPASAMLMTAAPYFFAAAVLILPGAILMGIAMAFLAGPLMKVSTALAMILPHAAGMPALALGLLLMGPALISFGFGLFMLGMFASLPFFSTGLDTFITALYAMAMAFQTIPTDKAVALGVIFSSLAQLTDLEDAGDMLFSVAMGIFWIARALETLPEEKTISMALLATNMSELITAAVELKPENVENVQGVVKAAAEYAQVASAMPTPDMDPFLQALKSALGLGGDSKDGGQDIVLELNGRELGRAIDAHIEKKHGLNLG
ncbi:MAG TPA: hypothetical protein EYN67_18740 [Flavobacteriales bacterium]|nr:hypothetical protein [Flavobacteriales bacterium]